MVENPDESRYNAIKRLRVEIHYLMKLGIIPVHFRNWEVIYEQYLKNKKKYDKKTEAIGVTSIELKVSERTVERIIKFMNES